MTELEQIKQKLKENNQEQLIEEIKKMSKEDQEKIKNIIKNLSKDHTVIIVAHRLSTIIDSDCIFVLNNHEIIDSGTHNELIKKCPEYKNLYEIEG